MFRPPAWYLWPQLPAKGWVAHSLSFSIQDWVACSAVLKPPCSHKHSASAPFSTMLLLDMVLNMVEYGVGCPGCTEAGCWSQTPALGCVASALVAAPIQYWNRKISREC